MAVSSQVSLFSEPDICLSSISSTIIIIAAKKNCQKIFPAHSMITKHNLILSSSYFCEEYSIRAKHPGPIKLI